MQDDQTETIEFLSTPAAYGLDPTLPVERHETHGSIVFLAGNAAYKLKRAVKFPYMDYSTPSRRKAMCEAELSVNRKLAPQLYDGVRPVVRDANGKLRLGDALETRSAIDWLVIMRRFEQDALFESLRRKHLLTRDLVERVAQCVAQAHVNAERSHDFGGSQGILAVIDENAALLRKLVGAPFARADVERWVESARTSLENVRRLLDDRRSEGFVRRCHGDLHLNNICLWQHAPVLFDAIEFNDTFALIDVLYDLAFLLMDLDRHGLRCEANTLLNVYLEQTQDYSGLRALPLFMSCRAALRAHVTVSMGKASAEQVREPYEKEAEGYLDRANAYLEPARPILAAIGGVSGTGKSTVAAALAPDFAPAPGAVVLRSDVIRKGLFGVSPTTRLPETAYGPDATGRVYDRLADRCAVILDAGYSAIADAVFGQIFEQQLIMDAARKHGAEFRGYWLEAPADVLERRIAARRNDVSDADIAVLRAQLRGVVPPKSWQSVDAAGSAENVLERIRGQSPTVPPHPSVQEKDR